MGIVTRLNEKIQSLQQKSVETLQKNEQPGTGFSYEYSKVLDGGLPEVTKDVIKVTEDPASDDDSIINGLPQTSPYVVNSSRKKRKRQEDSHLDSDDDLPCTPDAAEEPEFESLCAEIETLCVPYQRPLPVFPTPSDSKKVKLCDDDYNIDINTTGSDEDSYNVAIVIIESLVDGILE